jgi:hypothetical protein
MFPITISSANITIQGSYIKNRSMALGVDTAAYDDGALGKEAFREVLDEQSNVLIRQWNNSQGTKTREARIEAGVFCGDTYSDLILMECPSGENFIGLRFMARHLVTFNFPKQTMYLKRTSSGPLSGGE